MEIALSLPRARRRRRKPPPPSFWWALAGLAWDVACVVFWTLRLAGDMAAGDSSMGVDVIGAALFLKYIFRGVRTVIVIRGYVFGPVEGSWPKFRRELDRWLEDE